MTTTAVRFFGLLALAGLVAVTPTLVPGVRAQSTGETAASFITPFPENDLYQLNVLGDFMADGLLGGLVEALGGDGRLQIQRRARPIASLARLDSEDDLRQFEDQLAREQAPHIAVVMLGAQDRAPIRAGGSGRRFGVGSEEWRAEYGRRVNRVMKAIKRRNVAVYWIGLPIMRRPDWNADVEAINEVFREKAALNAVRFIDIYAETGDDSGQFSMLGPDITGKVRQLRDGDGIGFTPAGSRKVAFYVEREIKRDIATARAERNVPLMGSEAEQARISPRVAAPAIETPRETAARAAAPTRAPAQPSADTRAETSRVTFKAQTGGKDESITLDIVRPAIPLSVLAVVTRNQSADKPAQMGDTVADTLPTGLVVLRSVTPSSDSGRARATTPTQLPFFRALVRGERLPPKPGRADDFRWPREEDVAPAPDTTIPQPTVQRPAPKGAPRVPGRG